MTSNVKQGMGIVYKSEIRNTCPQQVGVEYRNEMLLEAQLFEPAGIESDEYKEQECKRPKRRSSVAEKGQRYPNNRRQTDGHTNIYREVKKQNGSNAIAVNPTEFGSVAFGKEDKAHQQSHK